MGMFMFLESVSSTTTILNCPPWDKPGEYGWTEPAKLVTFLLLLFSVLVFSLLKIKQIKKYQLPTLIAFTASLFVLHQTHYDKFKMYIFSYFLSLISFVFFVVVCLNDKFKNLIGSVVLAHNIGYYFVHGLTQIGLFGYIFTFIVVTPASIYFGRFYKKQQFVLFRCFLFYFNVYWYREDSKSFLVRW